TKPYAVSMCLFESLEKIATLEVDTSQELSVGELLERANRDRTPDFDEPTLIGGDIAVRSEADRNADPCTSNGCLWLKYTDGKVYIPYYIANHYSDREREIIVRGLDSFSTVSCIRFRPYQNGDHEWLSIESRNGCYSYVGRVGGGQTVSLSSQGCLYHSTVQHELLHALGFNHEQTRSDRDNHILVHWDNIIEGMEYNFYKINTLNQGTPYDYNSVMQYERYAFSKNNLPTMEPIPDSNVSFGKATQMSQNDIDRLNRLYNCCKCNKLYTITSISFSLYSRWGRKKCIFLSLTHEMKKPVHSQLSLELL
uniref:Metalloendopeptidase n=2 Tax=Xiphophorus TaxID=8082 RepID=A0A3B5QLA7_XIPMA